VIQPVDDLFAIGTSLAPPPLMLRAFIASFFALAVASTATNALGSEGPEGPEPPTTAEPPAEPATPAEAPAAPQNSHDDLLLTAGLGGFGEEPRTIGGLVSLTGLRQKGLLGYGATVEYGGAVFDYTTVTAAPMIGLFVDGPDWLRVGIAAAGGIHHYEGVGRGFISSTDPGASGTTPFIGARAFLGAETGGKVRFHIGFQLSLDDDLTRTRSSYTYQESSWTTPHAATASHTVGALRFGTVLALGTSFDL